MFKNLFKKKEIKDELDKALALALITKEEFLRLHYERANTKLKEFLKDKK